MSDREAPLRHAFIGIGAGIFQTHKRALEASGLRTEIVGCSDVSVEQGRGRAAEIGCPFFLDHQALLAETKPDVAVILTPHPYHASIAIDCLEAGCHVLVEKPMAVQVSEADAMIEAAEKADRLLAVNFQQRFRPEVQAARAMIEEGKLGKIQHVNLSAIWLRTEAYYCSGTWRATWSGEGGGVLMNQAPHDLDLACHLLGAPSRVFAWNRTLLHNIETEDTVQAMVEWPSGAMGSIHVSTAELGLQQRFEIFGTDGIIEIRQGDLVVQKPSADLREFITTNPDKFGRPKMSVVDVELSAGEGNHAAVYANFHDAILNETPLIVDGRSSRLGLELANAMIYSSYTQQEVELPLDRQAYAHLLADLRGE